MCEKPEALSAAPPEPLVQGNLVHSGIHGGFFAACMTLPLLFQHLMSTGKPFTLNYKAKLRRQQRTLRRDLAANQRAAWDKSIQMHVLRLVRSRPAKAIAAYWPFDGEPDIIPVCRQLRTEGIEIALPVIAGGNSSLMKFRSWQADSVLKCSSFGIFEPQDTPEISLSKIAVLLIPLVAYDQSGNRLGMGAGYYDRYLEPLRNLRTPLRVGIAYSLQALTRINKNKWDIPLHGVVNENGWLDFKEN